jgi:hypothetical protein
MNLKRTFRRASCLVNRLAANLGVSGATPLLPRFRSPTAAAKTDRRWLDGFYLDVPEEWDDPYRFFRLTSSQVNRRGDDSGNAQFLLSSIP